MFESCTMKAFCFVLAVFLSPYLLSQTPENKAQPIQSHSLLRLQRIHDGKDSCALLGKDGAYHFEEQRGNKTLVFEDLLDAATLQQLEAALDSPALLGLSDQQIPVQP